MQYEKEFGISDSFLFVQFCIQMMSENSTVSCTKARDAVIENEQRVPSPVRPAFSHSSTQVLTRTFIDAGHRAKRVQTTDDYKEAARDADCLVLWNCQGYTSV